MHIVLVGAGRTGRSIVRQATNDNHEVVIVESDSEVAAETSSSYDCLVIEGDGTARELLLEAEVPTADVLFSTTGDDSVNLMVMMQGKELGAKQLVCSINDPANRTVFENLGVNVVESPHELNGQYLYRRALRPGVKDFMNLNDGAEILELNVASDASLVGVSLLDAGERGLIPDQTVLVAIQRGSELIVPYGETVIQAGDTVTVFSRHGMSDDLLDVFEGGSM